MRIKTNVFDGTGTVWRVIDRLSTLAVLIAACVFLWVQHNRPSQSTPTRTPARVPSEPVAIADAPLLGLSTARVTMIEFSDFQCPFCGQFVKDILSPIKATYIDTGRVSLAFRHNPLAIHPRAETAAEAAECARQQGRFWPMHDQLFGDPKRLEDVDLEAYAKSVQMDMKSFDGCRAGRLSEGAVERDKKMAAALSLQGTPQFLIGVTRPDGTVAVRQVVTGARPFADFAAALDDTIKVAAARSVA